MNARRAMNRAATCVLLAEAGVVLSWLPIGWVPSLLPAVLVFR